MQSAPKTITVFADAVPAQLDVAHPASVIWGADLPDDGPTGGFFRDGSPLPW